MEELPYPTLPRKMFTVFTGVTSVPDIHYMLLGAQVSLEIEDRWRESTVRDAWIMLMRTTIGPTVKPAAKNLAVFLKYSNM